MPDYTVINVGKDSSGRDIYMTRHAWEVWEAVLARLPFGDKVVIVQGAFMTLNGGGASASAGYHDRAGCWDIRTWNLLPHEVDDLVRELRKAGIAAWRRDHENGGMDPHIHVVFGDDSPLASGAAVQWRQYLNGESGLSSRGRDYEWRPNPLVTKPPADLLEDDMASPEVQDQLNRIEKLLTKLDTRGKNEVQRDIGARERQARQHKRLLDRLDQLGVNDAEIKAILAEDEEEATP